MAKPVLAIDLGTTFLKTITFLLEGKSIRILNFTKNLYTHDPTDILKEKLREIILNIKNQYGFSSAIIGGGEGIGKGHICENEVLRKSHSAPINENELKEAIKDTQRKSLVEMKKKFGNENFFLVSAKIQNIAIDDYQNLSPIGLTGRKIHLEIVNFYLPLEIYQTLKEALSLLNIKQLSFEYIPQILPNLLLDYVGGDKSLIGRIGSQIKIFIDLGGKNTQVSIVEAGKLAKVIEINFGGDYFIERIAGRLKIKADQLFLKSKKRAITFTIKGKPILKENQQEIIQEILKKGNEKWTKEVVLTLEAYRQKKLPLEIYLLGGGSSFLLLETVKQYFAKKSFHCIIKKITPLDLKYIFNFDLDDHQATIPLLISKTLIKR